MKTRLNALRNLLPIAAATLGLACSERTAPPVNIASNPQPDSSNETVVRAISKPLIPKTLTTTFEKNKDTRMTQIATRNQNGEAQSIVGGSPFRIGGPQRLVEAALIRYKYADMIVYHELQSILLANILADSQERATITDTTKREELRKAAKLASEYLGITLDFPESSNATVEITKDGIEMRNPILLTRNPIEYVNMAIAEHRTSDQIAIKKLEQIINLRNNVTNPKEFPEASEELNNAAHEARAGIEQIKRSKQK